MTPPSPPPRKPPVLDAVPSAKEVAEGLRCMLRNTERQKEAAIHLMRGGYYEHATLLATARLGEIGRMIQLARDAHALEFGEDAKDEWKDAWRRLGERPYPWADQSAKLRESPLHKEMATGQPAMMEVLLHVQRGHPQWTTPELVAHEPTAVKTIYLEIGDMLLAEFFDDLQSWPLFRDDPELEIPRPTTLDPATYKDIPD